MGVCGCSSLKGLPFLRSVDRVHAVPQAEWGKYRVAVMEI